MAVLKYPVRQVSGLDGVRLAGAARVPPVFPHWPAHQRGDVGAPETCKVGAQL